MTGVQSHEVFGIKAWNKNVVVDDEIGLLASLTQTEKASLSPEQQERLLKEKKEYMRTTSKACR